eukprot:3443529-Prymnesium_polylepis.1
MFNWPEVVHELLWRVGCGRPPPRVSYYRSGHQKKVTTSLFDFQDRMLTFEDSHSICDYMTFRQPSIRHMNASPRKSAS